MTFDEFLAGIALGDLELSVRTSNLLRERGVRTALDLHRSFGKEHGSAMPSVIGRRGARDVREVIAYLTAEYRRQHTMTENTKDTRKTVNRSDVENQTAAAIATWLQAHALQRCAGAVVADAHGTTVNAAAAQTMLQVAAAIGNGEWRPGWQPPATSVTIDNS